MEIVLNGSNRDIPEDQTLLSLIESLELNPRLMVAQRNGEIVERERFAQVSLNAGDVVELVHIVGGG